MRCNVRVCVRITSGIAVARSGPAASIEWLQHTRISWFFPTDAAAAASLDALISAFHFRFVLGVQLLIFVVVVVSSQEYAILRMMR